VREDVDKLVDCLLPSVGQITHFAHTFIDNGPQPNLANVLQSYYHNSVSEVGRNSLGIRHELHLTE
jgi:hypothetical protein